MEAKAPAKETYVIVQGIGRHCWTLWCIHRDGGKTRLGTYPSRKNARNVARLLAGRSGVVEG